MMDRSIAALLASTAILCAGLAIIFIAMGFNPTYTASGWFGVWAALVGAIFTAAMIRFFFMDGNP